MSPKKVNCRCFTCVNVPYHVSNEIVKLNGIVFKSKPMKIENPKIKPKKGHSNTRFLETVLIKFCKNNKPTINIFSHIINSKQHIYLLYNHLTSKTLSLKVNMLCIKKTTKIETSSTAKVSKASQKNELLLTVPGESSYKDTFIT